jgi:plasmid replication initiation protein
MFSFLRSLLFGTKTGNSGEKLMVSAKKKTKSAAAQRANSTRTKQVVVLGTENTDLLPQGAIRSEVNFLIYPFFALSRTDAQKRMKAEYSATITRGDEKLDVYWKVSANPEYGYPGPFDRKVHKAIEQIISNLEKPIKNPIPLGSFYSIAQLLNLKKSGRFYSNIKAAIQRIVTTSVESKRTLYEKGRKRWLETTFHLYERVVFIGEELDNGEIADTNYLYLDSLYLDNINNRYVKPLDYTYHRSLKDGIASRLYELLGVKFYGMGRNPHIRYRYSTLCQLLPMTQYQYFSDAKRKVDAAHQELTRTGFLANIEWQEIPGAKHDWYLHYYPGPRAKEEIRQFRKQAALPPPDDLELGQMPPDPTPVRDPGPGLQQADEDIDNDVVIALQNFGISKKQAVKLAKEHEREYILEKLELVQWFIDTKSPQVSKNPAGFARRAIEEDYPAPPQYKSKKQQALEAEEKEREEQLRLNCALCEGTGYYKVAEDRMAECQHGRSLSGQTMRPLRLDT